MGDLAALWSAGPGPNFGLDLGLGSSAPPYPETPVFVDPTILTLLLSPAAQVVAFIWGLLWGSFCNVLIWRIPRGERVGWDRSRCGHCEAQIAWYDNIPLVSYLLLRGRCRQCKTRFSARYFVVELVGGVLSFALYMMHVVVPLMAGGGTDGLFAWQLWFVFSMALVVVTYVDLDAWIIPDEVVLPVGVVGLIVAGLRPAWLGVSLVEGLVAGLVGWALVAGLRWLYLKTRGIEALGLGDGKLLFMVGAFTGPFGLVWTLGAGALQGLLVSIPTLAFGGRIANSELEDVHGDDPELGQEDPDDGVMGQRVPFGPFLALAAFELVLLRPQLERVFDWLLYGVW